MKKVFLIHGFEGSPNGGWRPWLMGELAKRDIYACALPMPSPNTPLCEEWVKEIAANIEKNPADQVYLVGHSLGVPAILRYLEKAQHPIAGAVLVSGPCEKTKNEKLNSFFETPFDYETIKSKLPKVCIIHGDNDPLVSPAQAETLAKELNGKLIFIKNGGHLNGSSGWLILPEALDSLMEMFN